MIITVTCRHVTLTNNDKMEIKRVLTALREIDSSITRIAVIFTEQNHNSRSPKLVTCHVSIQAPHHRHIDIYENQPSISESFERASEQAYKRIQKISSINHHLHSSPSITDESEEQEIWNH